MKQEKDLSRADKYALNWYIEHKESDFLVLPEAYKIGKEIHESLQPKHWKPKALIDGYYFNANGTWKMVGELSNPKLMNRQAPTLELAARRLRNVEINNTINAWILESRDESENCIYYITYGHEWGCNHSASNPINQELCGVVKINKLVKLLNAGLIHGVPAKMEV